MRFLIWLLLLLSAVPFRAAEIHQAPELAKHFEAAGVAGTFVLFETKRDRFTVFNPQRAKERFVPASTFKIVNALIGLKAGAIKSVDEVLPYGGKPQPIPAWEKDMSIREGIRISNVPVFQEMARRIGLPRMAENVAAFDYGNGQIGEVVDRFWLDGPLKISAIEQTQFLSKLALRKLPVDEKHVAAVEEILRSDDELYAKTGWQPPIGWWVGWLKREGGLCVFALNMDIPKIEDAPKRISVGKACLRELGKL